ncbi:serine hydrolase RBBP9-like [Actinia tenebrosa]|uniref:Serine hydrolase RBBP9-like n=1 Tax=Actinia tenebrosa TaxID=6105 RepID=A0A6P8I0U4_ACTTE|nr:serine hydrolase RBBP9-like [Actinia tenebrosa]
MKYKQTAGRDMKVVIIPGNGCGDVQESNWYGWLREKLTEKNVKCLLKNMPDPIVARESVWLPFMEQELCCGEDTIIVGHSSGAEAAMRFAEKHKVHGIVLVSACVTDLGDSNEAASGYYNRPWEWTKMKDNTQWIVQFGSTDDPFISFDEQKEVANGTKAEFHQYSNKGHFNQDSFPELLKLLKQKLDA